VRGINKCCERINCGCFPGRLRIFALAAFAKVRAQPRSRDFCVKIACLEFQMILLRTQKEMKKEAVCGRFVCFVQPFANVPSAANVGGLQRGAFPFYVFLPRNASSHSLCVFSCGCV